MRVAQLMTTPVTTASPEDTVRDLAGMMLDGRSGSVVIVDHGAVVGIVTRSDLQVSRRRVPQSWGTVRAPAMLDEVVSDQQQLLDVVAQVRDVPACDVMSQPVRTAASDQPVWDVVEMFLSERIGHLPVVDDDALVGIVTRHDLLRLFTGGGERA